jgi:hypothetical protein
LATRPSGRRTKIAYETKTTTVMLVRVPERHEPLKLSDIHIENADGSAFQSIR